MWKGGLLAQIRKSALTSKLEGVREQQAQRESMPTAAEAAMDTDEGIVAQRALEKKQKFERARMNHYGNQRAVMEEDTTLEELVGRIVCSGVGRAGEENRLDRCWWS